MRFGLLLLAIISVSLASSDREEFNLFREKYGKSYPTQDEFHQRFANFQNNLKRNEALRLANPLATFGVNQFSDLSQEEFASYYLMDVDFSQFDRPAPVDFSVERPKNVAGCNPDATSYSWVDCNATTPVYDQGQCGSCWAFSATETIESYTFLSGGSLTQMSMQQLVSCDLSTNDGCNGGNPSVAYQYVQNVSGIEAYSTYPYTSGTTQQNGTCTFNRTEIVADVTSFASISGETGLYQQMSTASGGPVSVCVDASSWQSYTGGILTNCSRNIDHCVQAVGYANYGKSDAHWIVRNSWGATWGVKGYIYLAIGQDLCGIADQATVVVASQV